MRQFASKVWQSVQLSWQIIGITVMLCLLVEGGFRLKDGLTELIRGPVQHSYTSGDPQEKLPWFPQYVKEYDETRPQTWRSYVYWGRFPSYHGEHINIDSAGRRFTPQPTSPATPVARVFLFGGSTAWGTSQRDSQTIAAETARRLQTLAGPGQRIELTNYAENGYVTTQELLTLQWALRRGARPDIVVMYDGINDVGATVQGPEAGVPQNEDKRVREFAIGRTLDRSGFAQGLGKDLRAVALLAGGAFGQLESIEWVKSLKRGPAPTFIPADSVASATVRVYSENARMVEALSRVFGFTPIFIWQPTLQSSQKVRTPFEQRVYESGERDPYWRRIREAHQLIPALLRPAMATVTTDRFLDASVLFAGDTMAVFTDRIGHNTEASVPRIVDAFWPMLRSVVEQRRALKPVSAPSRTLRPGAAR